MSELKLIQQRTLLVRNAEIDVFQLRDGSYRISLEQMAKVLGINHQDLFNLLRSEVTQSLLEDEPRAPMLEEIVVEIQPNRQEQKRLWVITPEAMIVFLQWQSTQGNRRALSLLRELVAVSLNQFLDRTFETTQAKPESPATTNEAIPKPDPAWQAYLESEKEREEVYRRLAHS